MPIWDLEGGFADASQPWGNGHHTGLVAGRACSYHVPPRSPHMSQLALPAHKGWGEHKPPHPRVLRRGGGDHCVGSKSPGPAGGWGWSALPTAPALPPSLPPARPSWARSEPTGGRHGPWVGTAGLNGEQTAHEQERDKSDILRALGSILKHVLHNLPAGPQKDRMPLVHRSDPLFNKS